MQGILSIDVITALFAILPLAFIHVPQPERNAVDAEKTSVWTDFKAGLRYMISWPGLLIIGLMTLGINFTIIPAFSLLPLMVKDYFGGGAIHLSWVESAMGAGMILGGALLGIWGGFSRKILTSLVGLMGMGAGTLILALSPASAISLAVGAALLVGFMTPMTMGPFFAIIQSTVEPDMQARVFSLLSSVGTGITPLGLMIAGPVADRFGIQAWFLLGGILCIFMAMTGLFIPVVMNMENKGNPLPEVVSTSVKQAI
jgi:DHA3 family macrolide efflux protein-like MFS transporter